MVDLSNLGPPEGISRKAFSKILKSTLSPHRRALKYLHYHPEISHLLLDTHHPSEVRSCDPGQALGVLELQDPLHTYLHMALKTLFRCDTPRYHTLHYVNTITVLVTIIDQELSSDQIHVQQLADTLWVTLDDTPIRSWCLSCGDQDLIRDAKTIVDDSLGAHVTLEDYLSEIARHVPPPLGNTIPHHALQVIDHTYQLFNDYDQSSYRKEIPHAEFETATTVRIQVAAQDLGYDATHQYLGLLIAGLDLPVVPKMLAALASIRMWLASDITTLHLMGHVVTDHYTLKMLRPHMYLIPSKGHSS